jgi:hypothetical protein
VHAPPELGHGEPGIGLQFGQDAVVMLIEVDGHENLCGRLKCLLILRRCPESTLIDPCSVLG